mmetsp:Transcript_7565/g.14032  ORF Transcript_7565/g.14032 Transcript_7565/m.14032 type:complete len:228 (+) Transcript_7565:227-910(+)
MFALCRRRSSSVVCGRARVLAMAMASGHSAKSTKKKLVFATGNQNKLKEVRQILSAGEEDTKFPYQLEALSIDLPELQGEPDDIAAEKCRIAAEKVGGPVIVEDTCLCFNALKGLPGPYIKWFLTKLGHDGLNKLVQPYDDKTGYALCTFGFSAGPGSEPKIFKGKTDGNIVTARGPTDFGWDPIFEPAGYDKTYAELDKEIKNKISHRYKAVEALRKYLLSTADEA